MGDQPDDARAQHQRSLLHGAPQPAPRQRNPGEEVLRLRDNETGRMQTCELRDNTRSGTGWEVQDPRRAARFSSAASAMTNVKRATSLKPRERISSEQVRRLSRKASDSFVITSPTVLVLGAGASEPYGFPLGAALVDQICAEILHEDSTLVSRLRLRGAGRDHCRRFAKALQDARPYSIDTFLELRTEFGDVGKLAIADVLLRAENQRALSATSQNVDWYRYLIEQDLGNSLTRALRHPSEAAHDCNV